MPASRIIDKAKEVNADAIGLSALLVSTSQQMPLIGKMLLQANDDESKSDLNRIMDFAKSQGLGGKKVKSLGLGLTGNKKS